MALTTLTTINDDVLTEIQDEMKLRRTTECFLLFPLGSQTDAKIKFVLDQQRVFCLLADPTSLTAADVKRLSPKGIILSGGPVSVHSDPPPFDTDIFDLGIPVLGICLGMQLWAHYKGAVVAPATKAEYGAHQLEFDADCPLFDGLESPMTVIQSHSDAIEAFPGLKVYGKTDNAPVAAAQLDHLWGVQFHPEVHDTPHGSEVLANFCFKICQAKDRFPAASEAANKVAAAKKIIGNKHVLLALSGGSDSNVTAAILRAAGARVTGVYIKGIDRQDDLDFVMTHYGDQNWIDLRIVDATNQFLEALVGIKSFKDKRVAMRSVYKPILEEIATEVKADFIAQGTLYTDLSESGKGFELGKLVIAPETGDAPKEPAETKQVSKAVIKLHHNTNLQFSLPELILIADCVKDTARAIGRELGVPQSLLQRHPFPGPGLVVRILGEVTSDRLRIAREADSIFIHELREADLYDFVWQAGAVLTETVVTCTKGDGSKEGFELAVWAIHSVDGFTATPVFFEPDFFIKLSNRLTNEIAEIGCVTYRISSKPPTTIEFG